jgi:hypothetical protein
MSRLYEDTMTDQMRYELAEYCRIMGYVKQPVFFNPSRPDNHYFQAAGQEPPQEPPTARTLRNVCCWVMAWIIVGELILLLWPVLV